MFRGEWWGKEKEKKGKKSAGRWEEGGEMGWSPFCGPRYVGDDFGEFFGGNL